jgi:hypothetical protein
LRKNFKKIEPAWIISVLLLFFAPNQISPQDIELKAEQSNGLLSVSARLESMPYGELFTSLQDGLEAEIIFQLRLYQKAKGLFSILGDRLRWQQEPSHSARMNLYDGTYSLIASSGEILNFERREDFIESFSSIRIQAPYSFEPENRGDYYLRARIRLNHVKLVPPLNLIYILGPIGFTTDWKEMAIVQSKGEVR